MGKAGDMPGGGPADESAPKGLRPQRPLARAGDRANSPLIAGDTGIGQTLGVVLAGGLSRRMGALGPKAALPIGGESLLTRVVGRLRTAGLPDVLVVGPPKLDTLTLGAALAADRRPGAHGPLAGLETALLWAADLTPRPPLPRGEGVARSAGGEVRSEPPYRRVFVVACDMPFVCPALVRAMAERAARMPGADALVLRSATGTEQLHAVYTLACLPIASALLDAGARSLRELLARVRVVEFPAAEAARFDPDGRSAFNANTPDDWRRALEIAATDAARS